jgi:hypothetical protein
MEVCADVPVADLSLVRPQKATPFLMSILVGAAATRAHAHASATLLMCAAHHDTVCGGNPADSTKSQPAWRICQEVPSCCRLSFSHDHCGCARYCCHIKGHSHNVFVRVATPFWETGACLVVCARAHDQGARYSIACAVAMVRSQLAD